MTDHGRHVLALCGGVGGAKLAAGLARILPPDDLTVVVNTGDDFEHLGLTVCPDLDTVTYTLAGLADPERGWGLEGETWNFMAAVRRLGGESWFQLGDSDLATHVLRSQALRAGESLSSISARLAGTLGIAHGIVPMSDQPVRTWLETSQGMMPFQHYFVGARCEPMVRSIRFEGADAATPSPGFSAALARPDLAAIVICPSNPYLSIDPILAIPGVTDSIVRAKAPCVAVSPVIAGAAVKGPTTKVMDELGVTPGVAAIAAHYRNLIDGLVVDTADTAAAGLLDISWTATRSLMRDDADRVDLARKTLAFAMSLGATA